MPSIMDLILLTDLERFALQTGLERRLEPFLEGLDPVLDFRFASVILYVIGFEINILKGKLFSI